MYAVELKTPCGSDMRKEAHEEVAQRPARFTGSAITQIRISKSRLNASLRDGYAVGLQVDAIPLEEVTRCGIRNINDHRCKNICQAVFFKT
jgi:hypothetical protein